MLCKQLEDSGYVTAEFEKSVLEHEVTAPTALGKELRSLTEMPNVL